MSDTKRTSWHGVNFDNEARGRHIGPRTHRDDRLSWPRQARVIKQVNTRKARQENRRLTREEPRT